MNEKQNTKNKINTFLCGGVFLFLLSNTFKNTKNPDLMAGLINVITGKKYAGEKGTLASRTSSCINCSSDYSIYIPINNNSGLNFFINNFLENKFYTDYINRMDNFILGKINDSEGIRLVKSLLYIIENDSKISDNQKFYIINNSDPITKNKIKEITSFSLSAFLLGIIYFIVTKRNNVNNNKEAEETLNFLGSQNGNIRILENDISIKIDNNISISLPKDNKPKVNKPHIVNNTKNILNSSIPQNNLNSTNYFKIKDIFYKSNMLDGNSDEYLFDPKYEIIDLNNEKNFEFEKLYKNKIFMFKTIYTLKPYFNKNNEYFAKISTNYNNFTFRGLTSYKNWYISSQINAWLVQEKAEFKSYFIVDSIEKEYIGIKFLLIVGDKND